MSKRLIWVGELEGSCALISSFLPPGFPLSLLTLTVGTSYQYQTKTITMIKCQTLVDKCSVGKKREIFNSGRSWLFGLPLNNSKLQSWKNNKSKVGEGNKASCEAGKTIVHFSFCHLCPLTTGDWENANITPPSWLSEKFRILRKLIVGCSRRRPSMWPMVWGGKKCVCVCFYLCISQKLRKIGLCGGRRPSAGPINGGGGRCLGKEGKHC